MRFNERCRIDGRGGRRAERCCRTSRRSRRRAATSALTYFEFTTLAIARLLAAARARPASILEVGLGGRLDAVNIFDADCAVVTSIDIDHVDYLGPDRESIGREKAGILRRRPAGDRAAIRCRRASVVDARRRRSAPTCGCVGRDFNHAGDRQQWSWTRPRRTRFTRPGATRRCAAPTSCSTRRARSPRSRRCASACRSARRRCAAGWRTVELPGRFQIVPGQPTLVLDVAHNPHAVAALAHNLDQMGFFPRTHAVFGAMRDKDVAGDARAAWRRSSTLALLATCRRRARRGAAELAAASTRALGDAPAAGGRVTRHAEPARRAARRVAGADPADRIVVFGSFYTVGGVLADGAAPADRSPTLG